jgi:hypothetical protein
VIKNFIKLYEYNHLDYASSQPYIVHYFGVSDWLREVRAGDNTIGGNLLATARTYVVGKTGSVSGTIVGAKYVIGIPAGAPIGDYTMPPLGSDATLRENKIKHANAPTFPVEAADSVPAQLMYRAKVEKFRIDWNKFLVDVNTNYNTEGYGSPQELHETEWTAYHNAAENFKIPPLATYCDASGNYTITNIAPGNYDFYYSKTDLDWGELFIDDDFGDVVNGYFSASNPKGGLISGGTNLSINAGDHISIP